MGARRAIPRLAALAVGLLLPILFASTAHAYPWMIRHGYTGCTPCHTDPSGGAGALTQYGRAQGDLLLRTRYGKGTDEADRTAGFLWGLVPLPEEQVRLGGDFRYSFFSSKEAGAPAVERWITMRADLYGDFKVWRFRGAGSIGYAPDGALAASLTDAPNDNLVSREHWLGFELDDEGSWLVRAGRITLPFGIRMIEHNLFARVLTRTDINDTQQYGVALSVSRDKYRGEVMGILGNYQIRQDDFRERGYSAYFEYAPMTTLAVGASSSFTRARRDIVYSVTDYRYANGLFARYAPLQQLVLLAEADSVYQSLTYNGHRGGYAALLQGDYEPVQGVHAMLTAEAMNGGASGEPDSYEGWLSAVWFFLPHVDVRLDAIYSSLGVASTSGVAPSHSNITTWLAQFHVFL